MDNQHALPLHGDPHAANRASAALRTYWDGLRAGRPAPHRRDLRPASLGPVLSHTFVLESRADARATYRLAGSAIFDIFQRELRGLDWLTLFEERTRPAASSFASAALSGAEIVLARAEGLTARRRMVPIEILLLPLVTEPDESPRALGSIETGDRPYWLGAQPIVELTSLEVQFRESLQAGSVKALSRNSAAPAQIWRGPIRRLRHLALYLGGQQG